MVFQPGQSGNPAGRPRGSINKQLHMLRAATEVVLPLVLARALGGDFEAQKLILERGLLKIKPVELPVEFELPEEGAASPIRAILEQAAAGELPLAQAKEIVTGLLPAAIREEKTIERKMRSSGRFYNAYVDSVMRG